MAIKAVLNGLTTGRRMVVANNIFATHCANRGAFTGARVALPWFWTKRNIDEFICFFFWLYDSYKLSFGGEVPPVFYFLNH